MSVCVCVLLGRSGAGAHGSLISGVGAGHRLCVCVCVCVCVYMPNL